MCGRFSLFDLLNLKIRYNFDLDLIDWLKPRYNIAPSQGVLTIIKEEKYLPKQMKWGITPFWSRGSGASKILINARGETIDKKASFKQSFFQKRCLIPADGFYEWDNKGREKRPYRFALKECDVFSFAGLWDSWESPQGHIITACAIITTTANGLIKPIHKRMPVILNKEAEEVWVSEEVNLQKLKDLLRPYPEDLMVGYKVSNKVNSPRNDSPQVMDPA